jgi:hypothetical protein
MLSQPMSSACQQFRRLMVTANGHGLSKTQHIIFVIADPFLLSQPYRLVCMPLITSSEPTEPAHHAQLLPAQMLSWPIVVVANSVAKEPTQGGTTNDD